MLPSGRNFPFLEDAQKAGLEIDRHLRDLVEKKCAAAGRAQHAGKILARAGENAPFLYPNNSPSINVLRKGRAVELDQRTRAAGALLVNAVGEDLLADAAFPDDEDVRVAGRDLVHKLKELAHFRILEDRLQLSLGALDPLLQPLGFLPQLDRFLPQAAMFERLADETEQFFRHIGFADEMERADLDRGDGVVERIVGRDHDDRKRRIFLANRAQ